MLAYNIGYFQFQKYLLLVSCIPATLKQFGLLWSSDLEKNIFKYFFPIACKMVT